MYLHDMEAIQDKHLAARQLGSANVMALIYPHPDDVVYLTATMSDLNVPSNVVKDNQMGVYICWVRCRYCLAGITKLGEQVAKYTKLE